MIEHILISILLNTSLFHGFVKKVYTLDNKQLEHINKINSLFVSECSAILACFKGTTYIKPGATGGCFEPLSKLYHCRQYGNVDSLFLKCLITVLTRSNSPLSHKRRLLSLILINRSTPFFYCACVSLTMSLYFQ